MTTHTCAECDAEFRPSAFRNGVSLCYPCHEARCSHDGRARIGHVTHCQTCGTVLERHDSGGVL